MLTYKNYLRVCLPRRAKIEDEYMEVRNENTKDCFLEPTLDSCPICGQIIGTMQGFAPSENYFSHRCKKSTLKAINSARTRESNHPSRRDLNQMGYGDVLNEAFKLNNMAQEYSVT